MLEFIGELIWYIICAVALVTVLVFAWPLLICVFALYLISKLFSRD